MDRCENMCVSGIEFRKDVDVTADAHVLEDGEGTTTLQPESAPQNGEALQGVHDSGVVVEATGRQ